VGVVREAARLANSAWVFACWSLMFTATGPVETLSALTLSEFSDRSASLPLVTLWVIGWFATALAAAEVSR
jgi:hypothetical protein